MGLKMADAAGWRRGAMRVAGAGLSILGMLMLTACSSADGDARLPAEAPPDPAFLIYLSEWDEADAPWLDELADRSAGMEE